MTTQTHRSAWNSSLELVRALIAAGTRVSLGLVGGGLAADQRRDLRRLRGVDVVRDADGRVVVARSSAERRQIGELLLREADRVAAQLIHLDGIAHVGLEWGRPTLVSVRTSQCGWWHAVRKTPLPRRWEAYRSMVARALARADAVVVPTLAMSTTLGQFCDEDVVPRVIYLGRDPYRFRPGLKSPYVLAVGSVLDEAKNLALLDEVVSGLAWPILVAGSPQEPGRIEHGRSRRLGVLTGKEIGAWLSHASIFALPARHEPLGVSVLEAALSGAALVLADIPELRELWSDVAFFVPPDDSEAMRHAIEALITDAELRRTFGVRARLRALHFSPGRMAAAYQTLYAELVTTGRWGPTFLAPPMPNGGASAQAA